MIVRCVDNTLQRGVLVLGREYYSAAAIAVIIAVSCSAAHGQIAPKGPEPATLKANAELTKTLPFANRQDFEDAMRGFIGTTPDALVTDTGPRPVWSMKPYDSSSRTK
jgi:alkyl sulfatase BDS1-like metallo-beta-lactamase superfamily hydrolase